MLWNFGDGLAKINEMSEVKNDIAEETKKQLDNIDSLIKKNDANLGSAAQRARQAQIALAQVEKYLQENAESRNVSFSGRF